MEPLADHIASLSPDVEVVFHRLQNTTDLILTNDSESVVNDTEKHHVLLYDWHETSIIKGEASKGAKSSQGELSGEKAITLAPNGYAYAAGDALYALVRKYNIQNKVHAYIGHSRGAIVGSEFVRRMFIRGSSITQVIYLDGEGGDVLEIFTPFSDLRHTAWEAPSGTGCRFDNIYSRLIEASCYVGDYGGLHRPRCNNYDLGTMYYRHGMCDTGMELVDPIWMYLIDYMSFDGEYYEFLDRVSGEVPQRGGPTLAPMDTDNWDSYPIGWYEGGSIDNPSDPWSGLDCQPHSNPFDRSLFNGDFAWGSEAGWKNHGGIFDATLISQSVIGFGLGAVLGLDSDGENRVRHGWTYFPQNADKISFDLRTLQTEILFPETDNLLVTIHRADTGQIATLCNITVNKENLFFDIDHTYTIPEDFRGATCTIDFKYTSNGDNFDYKLYLDNIAILSSGDAPPTISMTSPSDGEVIGEDLVTIDVVATDPDQGVQRVDFFVDQKYLGTSIEEPYKILWNPTTHNAGTHTILARAVSYGQLYSEVEVQVVIPVDIPNYNNDYEVVSLSASPGNPIVGEVVSIQAHLVNSGLDDQPSGCPIEFYVDGQLKNVSTSINALEPGEGQDVFFSWNAVDGAHNMRVSAKLFGDENPTNNSKEIVVVAGSQGSLLVDGSLAPSRTISMPAGGNGSYSFQLTNPGQLVVPVSISVAGDVAGWVSVAQTYISVEPGEPIVLPFVVSIPSGTSVGSYSALISFDYGAGTVVSSLDVRVREYRQGEAVEPLEGGPVAINGNWESTENPGHGTYFFLDNDPATAEQHFRAFSLDLGAGTGSKFERMVEATWIINAREESSSSGMGADLRLSGEADDAEYESDINHPGFNIMEWMVAGDNNVEISLNSFAHDQANVNWYITESKVFFVYTQDAWSKDLTLYQPDLDLWEAGWNSGRVYFDVENVSTPGDLHLYINGRLADTVSSSDRYFSFSHSRLATQNTFNIKGDADDNTVVTLSNIELVVDYFAGDPDIVGSRTLPTPAVLVNQVAPVNLSFLNNGSNIAENIQYFEEPLPTGLALVSGSLNGAVNDLDPGETGGATYAIKAVEPGLYGLGSRLITYENPLGVAYSSTMAPITLEVAGGSVSLALQAPQTVFSLGSEIPMTCHVSRDVDGAIIQNAVVMCSIQNPSGQVSNLAMTYDPIDGAYRVTYGLAVEIGSYLVQCTAEAPFYDPAQTGAALGFDVANDIDLPEIVRFVAAQQAQGVVVVNATIVTGDSGATWKVHYGLSPAYGNTSEPIVLPPSTEPVDVGAVVSDLVPGNTYHFQLVAGNAGGNAFSGNQAVLMNHAPQIGWTQEEGYTQDAFEPPAGDEGTEFVFRVSYSDLDGHGPAAGYPRVNVFDSGLPIPGSPFEMVQAGTQAIETGRVYAASLSELPVSTALTYQVEALDLMLAEAEGLTGAYSGPDVGPVFDVSLSVMPGELFINEGESGTVGLRLGEAPSSNLIVSISFLSGDQDVSLLGPSQVTFTPTDWDLERNIEFSALPDADDEGGVATFLFRGTSGPSVEDYILSVTEKDSEGCLLAGSGDLNCDCNVNILDVVLVTGNYGIACGDPHQCTYDCEISDIVPNCMVDILDVVSVTGYYGQACGGQSVQLAGITPKTGQYWDAGLRVQGPSRAIGDTIVVFAELKSSGGLPFAYQVTLNYEGSPLTLLSCQPGNIFDSERVAESIGLVGQPNMPGVTPFVGGSFLGGSPGAKSTGGVLAKYVFRVDGPDPIKISWKDDACLVVGAELEVQDVNWGEALTIRDGAGVASGNQFSLAGKNPSSSQFDFKLQLVATTRIELNIYDTRGHLVRNLASQSIPSGKHMFIWNGRDNNGRRMQSGVYFARLSAAGEVSTKRVVWLK